MTRNAFANASTIVMAVGGSTQAALREAVMSRHCSISPDSAPQLTVSDVQVTFAEAGG